MNFKKILLIIAISIAVLITALVIFTQTPAFRSIILDIIHSQAADNLNGNLHISGLQGNFFTWLTFKEITVTDEENNLLLYLEEIKLQYSLPALLRKRIVINLIELNLLELYLSSEDGVWNVSKLLKTETDEPEEEETTQPFDWRIILDKFSINEATVNITTDDPETVTIPSSIYDLNLNLAMSISDNEIDVNLQEFNCSINWNDEHLVNINHLAFNLKQSEQETKLQDFIFRTDHIDTDINGLLNRDEEMNYSASLEIVFSNLQDIAYFVPLLDSDSRFSVVIVASGDDDRLNTEMRLYTADMKNESLKAELKMNNPMAEDFLEILDYEVRVLFSHFDPFIFLTDSEESLMLNGGLRLSGNSFDINHGDINLDLQLKEALISAPDNRYLLSEFIVSANLSQGKLESKIDINADEIADLQLNISVADINSLQSGEDPLLATDYSISGRIDNLNTADILNSDHQSGQKPSTGSPDLTSNLNFDFSLSGDKNTAALKLEFSPSSFAGMDITSFLIHTTYNGQIISIEQFNAAVKDNVLQINGALTQSGQNSHENRAAGYLNSWHADLNYSFIFPDIVPLIIAFSDIEENFNTAGQIKGTVFGFADSLMLTGELHLTENSYDTIGIENILTTFSVSLHNNSLFSEIVFNADEITIGEESIQSVNLTASTSIDSSNEQLEIDSEVLLEVVLDDEMSLETDLKLSHKEKESFLELDLSARIGDIVWSTNNRKAKIAYIDDRLIKIDSLRIYSANQELLLDGHIFLDGSEENDLHLKLSDISLEMISLLTGNDGMLKGFINYDLQLSGTSHSPQLSSKLVVSDIEFDSLQEISIEGDFFYPEGKDDWYGNAQTPADETFAGKITITHAQQPYADLLFYIPLNLNLSEGLEMYPDKKSYLSLNTQDIDLAMLEPILQGIDGIRGTLQAELEINHSLNSLKKVIDSFGKETDDTVTQEIESFGEEGSIVFNLKVNDAGMRVPELGTRYRDINIDISTENNKLDIKSFEVRSGEGTLSVNGDAVLEPQSSPLSLTLNSQSFPLIANEALEIIINSNLTLSGTLEEPQFSGEIFLPRGRVNLDRLLENGTVASGETPLLVQAREQAATVEEDETKRPAEDTSLQVIDKSRGRMAVRFPRNVWIRSSDMNIELSADLEIVKRDVHFEIFGSVSTIRGFYALYGKRFQIESGEVIFSGGREINPSLSLVATYNFRGIDMARNTLKLLVSGSMEELEISFQLNNEQIEEADAISYLLFGRSFDELTQGEKAEASNQALVLGGILANRLAGVLTDFVGESLSLDFIEFRSDTASSQIGLEVGKYLTDKLFVSYKKDFNLSDSQETVTDEVVVEYEIKPFLYLQGTKSDDRNTGIDLIWRLSWE